MNENEIDIHIGEKIRSRRHILGMNQTDLGKKIGVTFQQVQKYEKGHNKIVASKLFDLAVKMDVPVNYFFDGFAMEEKDEGLNEILSVNEEALEFSYEDPDDVSSREAISLVKTYNSIRNKSTRKKLLVFLKTLASD